MSTQSTTPQQGSDVTIITEPEIVWEPTYNIKQGKNVANRGHKILSEQGSDKQPPLLRSRPLNHRQRRFTQIRGTQPKLTNAEVVIEAGYNPSTKAVASQIAHELLKKPEIKTELAKYEGRAEHNLMVLADKTTEYALQGGKDGASYASVAERTNNSIIDRLRGKATIKTENTTSVVTLNIDLTGAVDNEQEK